MKHIVSDEKSAVEYIQMILNEWEVWQTHHTGLVEAMKILLSANKKLTDEVDRLKLSLAAETERSESRKEADISEILELRLKVEQIFEEIDNALHDMAMEYYNAGHPEYFAVCEMVHHKVVRHIEKKYTEGK